MSTLNSNPIASAVRSALLVGAAAALAMPTLHAAEDDGANDEKVVITGSRIKRADVEGALPVTVIDREQLELSGESNAADFIRSLTFNSAGSFRPQSGSSAQGTAQVSLRGLGANRTLVLIDGRRIPNAAATGSGQDLNVIPLGAIERIEVLTDGASAIYGSDAIGGVINVVLRKDFEGAEIMLGQATVSIPSEGGDREEGNVLFGASGAKSSIIAGISFNDRDIVFARAFPWTPPGGSIYGNSFTTLDSDGNDEFNWVSIPDGQGGTACDFPGSAFYTLGARCAYDFTQVSADEASIKNKAAFWNATYEINADWELYNNTRISRTESFGRYAPVPDSSFFASPLTVNSPNNPTNPNGNVYDAGLGLAPQEVNVWHRFDALGNRDGFVTNNMSDILVGATGYVGDVELDFGYRTTKNKNDDVGRNYLLRSAAYRLIESGEYNLADPYANDEDVLNQMRITIYRESIFDQEETYASAAFDMFEMDAGMASAFVGYEFRKEIYSDQYDPQSEAGQVGGSAGNSAGGDRDVTSIAFEALFPMMENLELSVAGRMDDYSDFGDNFSPKVSVRYQPMEDLTLRASFGEGFRAPTLPALTQKTTFSATSVSDPQSCVNQSQPSNCSLQINDFIQSNPELEAETSEQFALGAAYSPTDWMDVTFDYFDIAIENRIRSFGAQFLINSEIAGNPVPAGLGCERTQTGSIIQCFTGFGNQGEVDTQGFDVNFNARFDVLDGRLITNVQWSRVMHQSVDGGRNLIQDPGLPKDRMVINNTFAISDFTVAWNVNVIGTQYNDPKSVIFASDYTGEITDVETWITHDLQFNWDTPLGGRLTVGAQNITENFPPIGEGFPDSRDYDFNLYDGFGRVAYVRYRHSF